MRLVSFDSGDGPHAGVLDTHGGTAGDQVLPVSGGPTLDELLAGGLPSDLQTEGAVEHYHLLAPLQRPSKLICIGLNYLSHCVEQGAEPPETPTFFAKFPNALAAPGATVRLPKWSRRVDYEAEVAFVVGSRAKDVPEELALGHIAGYSLMNDLSARDYQFKTPQWMPGKTFDGAAPFGPAIVTADEAGPPDAIELELRLNGELMQSGSTAELVHSIPALVVYLSKLMTLEPGDVVSTGTPAGVGSLRDPKVWLKPGDEVEIASPSLGVLDTTLA